MWYDHEQEQFEVTAMARYNFQLTQSVHQSTAKTDTRSVHSATLNTLPYLKIEKTFKTVHARVEGNIGPQPHKIAVF